MTGERIQFPSSLSCLHLQARPAFRSSTLARARARAHADDALLSRSLSPVNESHRWPAGSNETKPRLASLLPARALVPRATFLPDGDLSRNRTRALSVATLGRGSAAPIARERLITPRANRGIDFDIADRSDPRDRRWRSSKLPAKGSEDRSSLFLEFRSE